jgi:hypothetical protein
MIRNNFISIFDSTILFFGLFLYLVNSLAFREEISVFLDFYFNDILAGLLIISLANIIIQLSKFNNIVIQDNIRLCVLLLVSASFIWEVIPLKDSAIFDLWDILCYFTGGFLNVYLYKFIKSH